MDERQREALRASHQFRRLEEQRFHFALRIALQSMNADWSMTTIDRQEDEPPLKPLPFAVFETIDEEDDLDLLPPPVTFVPLDDGSSADVSVLDLCGGTPQAFEGPAPASSGEGGKRSMATILSYIVDSLQNISPKKLGLRAVQQIRRTC